MVEKMRGVQIPPAIPIAFGIVLVVIIGYFAWWKPKTAEEKTLRDFNTPEAQAKRDPDQRKVSESLQEKIKALRDKEQQKNRGISHGRM